MFAEVEVLAPIASRSLAEDAGAKSPAVQAEVLADRKVEQLRLQQAQTPVSKQYRRNKADLAKAWRQSTLGVFSDQTHTARPLADNRDTVSVPGRHTSSCYQLFTLHELTFAFGTLYTPSCFSARDSSSRVGMPPMNLPRFPLLSLPSSGSPSFPARDFAHP